MYFIWGKLKLKLDWNAGMLICYDLSKKDFRNNNFARDGILIDCVPHEIIKNLNETKMLPVLAFYNLSELCFRRWPLAVTNRLTACNKV